jgi:hypothetical protein
MPYTGIVIPRRRRQKGTYVPATTKGASTGKQSRTSPVINPKAAAPIQPTFAATEQTLIYSDQKSLSTTKLTQGNTILFPNTDIIELDLNITETITGTVSVANDVCNLIDHIDFFDGTTGSQISTIPGGTYLYDHLVRFYPVKGAYVSAGSAPSNAIGTSATSATAVLKIPVRIPASQTSSPNKAIIYYATVATAAGSATSVAITVNVYPVYGSAEGQWMVVRSQNVSLAVGQNFVSQLAIPANVPVSELFLRTGTVTNISWLQIMTGTQTVLPYTEEAVIAARDSRDFGSALQSTTLCLDLGTTFGVGPNSQFYLNCGTSITNEQLVWVWFQ